MQNRWLAKCSAENWFFQHKFLDPTVYLDSPLNPENDPEVLDATIESLEIQLRPVLHKVGESTEVAWIFLPYNIGYDFNHLIKASVLTFRFFHALIHYVIWYVICLLGPTTSCTPSSLKQVECMFRIL